MLQLYCLQQSLQLDLYLGCQNLIFLRYRPSRVSESNASEMLRKTPSKVTIKAESEIFGTRLAHYGVNIMAHSTPDLIPEKLPIEKVSDTIKRIPLANGNRGKGSPKPVSRLKPDKN